MLASPPFNICTKGGQANSDFELHLQGIARRYQAATNLCKFPRKRKGDLHTQQICYACGKEHHVALQCQSPKIPNLDHLKKKACSHCGEEGHQAGQCPGNCPNCEVNHPPRECPTSNITCYMCESSTHVPADCAMNHLVSDISKILPNSFQLAAQVVKTSKEHDSHRKQQKARNKKKKERRIRRQVNKPLAPSNLCYNLNLRSGRTLSKDTYPKHGDTTNIIYWKCGIQGHYSNECPTMLNAAPEPPITQDPVITKESVKPSCSEDPTNVLSSSGGNPINTNLGRVRNCVIIEDSVKGLYSLKFRRGRKQPYRTPESDLANPKAWREEKEINH
jgi:hypothetical protein